MKRIIAIVAILFAVLLPLEAQASDVVLTLNQQLFLAGSFPTTQAITADASNVYLGSEQGSLFILQAGNGKNAGKLVTKTTLAIGSRITAVDQDANNFYLTTDPGSLYSGLLRITKTLRKTTVVNLSTYGLSNISTKGTFMKVSLGTAAMAGNSTNVFVSELNNGDFTIGLNANLSPNGTEYGRTFFGSGATSMYSESGTWLQDLTNPAGSMVSLYATDTFLAMTQPGNAGAGVYLYRVTPTGATFWAFLSIPYANDVVEFSSPTTGERYLIVGTESGYVHVVDLNDSTLPLKASIDLRRETGHTGAEDIEIRALAVNVDQRKIIAASSWGTTATRSSSLPSAFVINLNIR